MAAARLSSHDPESGGCCLCSSPLSFHSGTGSERPGAVQGAPLFGAAERTLDGEDRSEIITEGRKGACFRLLRTHYRPIIPAIALTSVPRSCTITPLSKRCAHSSSSSFSVPRSPPLPRIHS